MERNVCEMLNDFEKFVLMYFSYLTEIFYMAHYPNKTCRLFKKKDMFFSGHIVLVTS